MIDARIGPRIRQEDEAFVDAHRHTVSHIPYLRIAQKKPVAKADGDGLTFTLSENGTASCVLRFNRGTGGANNCG
ncbi:hypothetical protein FRZ40_24845 [Paraburkholderia azotifigens]|uniref:Uncharacterized protein n=1 Tax=Paraburkholderia azotifigens TaxID=2057004 RepID=A0A5C6VIS4_9BURK|nr:hypothetical protein FRZ40_24845 [Paraburkholderia azotifigens]